MIDAMFDDDMLLMDGGDARRVSEVLPVPEAWARASEAVHLDPETYVPAEVVLDEVATRINANRGRPHPIPDRPLPTLDLGEDPANDPGYWEFREELRECAWCGEPFFAQAHNHAYCSEPCARRGTSYVRTCVHCGMRFLTNRFDQIYCSITCTGLAKRRATNDRSCRQCGGGFRATRPEQRFCCRACAWLWRRGVT